jgi:ABC-type multidrug transport system ATPase subunit
MQMSGDVTYNGYKFDEFVIQKTAGYTNQNDLHVAAMIVRETLEFSAKSQDVGPAKYGPFSPMIP